MSFARKVRKRKMKKNQKEIELCGICEIDEKSDNDNNDKIIKTQCGHYYHKSCIDKWMYDYHKLSCPVCRFRLREPTNEEKNNAMFREPDHYDREAIEELNNNNIMGIRTNVLNDIFNNILRIDDISDDTPDISDNNMAIAMSLSLESLYRDQNQIREREEDKKLMNSYILALRNHGLNQEAKTTSPEQKTSTSMQIQLQERTRAIRALREIRAGRASESAPVYYMPIQNLSYTFTRRFLSDRHL